MRRIGVQLTFPEWLGEFLESAQPLFSTFAERMRFVTDLALERPRPEHDADGEREEDRDNRDQVVAEIDHVNTPTMVDQKSSSLAPMSCNMARPPSVALSAAPRASIPTRSMAMSHHPLIRDR